ncbi:hypothetical protein [Polynucleobacter sp. IMCC 30228]|uniref:hypothetical protein n=1 Tax=Polynucleobacter sp. IMCC 30228 TaxID=2781011 RepID=UPI001F232952|nr:hypothetical protein [Polynucleobacter sp. IMCC 30228]MCE7527889.1 hypothetical protein [Polynucleobacter sp. IMCC 30228]
MNFIELFAIKGELILLALVLLLLIFVWSRSWRLCEQFGVTPFLGSSFLSIGFIYLSSLVPGILGVLSPFISQVSFFILCGLFLFFTKQYVSKQKVYPFLEEPKERITIFNTKVDLIIFVTGIILCGPFLLYIKDIPLKLFDPHATLGWDVVSYHLPAWIEFYQKQSLWSVLGPYQSYSFGFELIGMFFSQGFHAHWGLLIAHIIALALVVGSIALVCGAIFQFNSKYSLGRLLSISVLAIGIWSITAPQSFGAVGKNDLFMAACIFSALGFSMRLIQTNHLNSASKKLYLIVIGICVGLGISTKPSALLFLGYFPLLIGVSSYFQQRQIKKALFAALFIFMLAFSMGGFWTLRNLILFGELSPVLTSWGLNTSVLANLNNALLYQINGKSILVFMALFACVPSLVMPLIAARSQKIYTSWWVVFSFHCIAMITFLITPFMFQKGQFELRLAAPLFLSASVIYAFSIMDLATDLEDLIKRVGARIRRLFLGFMIFIVFIVIAVAWNINSIGLPGYEKIGPHYQTGVYAWIQVQDSPLRIFAVGLRPYGLYGKNWNNTVFYDLSNETISPVEEGKKRIISIVLQFRPELILIADNPFASTEEVNLNATIAWLNLRSDLFKPVYQDKSVIGFAVLPKAVEILSSENYQNIPIKMGG